MGGGHTESGPIGDGLVWYAGYGANAAWERFACYVAGGTPPGGTRANPGCRDRTPPRAQAAVWLPGGVYFGLDSPMWGGGLAMLDAALPGAAPARAYLVTAGQFSDIAAQEMYRAPGAGPDPREALATGRAVLGEGRYETLLLCGAIGGRPLLTFTAHWPAGAVEHRAPSAAYLRTIGRGLAAVHRWGAERTGAYLAGRPGARGTWSAAQAAALLEPGQGAGSGAPAGKPVAPPAPPRV
ncbi:histone deacetylase [Nocardiopsis coralliicola]